MEEHKGRGFPGGGRRREKPNRARGHSAGGAGRYPCFPDQATSHVDESYTNTRFTGAPYQHDSIHVEHVQGFPNQNLGVYPPPSLLGLGNSVRGGHPPPSLLGHPPPSLLGLGNSFRGGHPPPSLFGLGNSFRGGHGLNKEFTGTYNQYIDGERFPNKQSREGGRGTYNQPKGPGNNKQSRGGSHGNYNQSRGSKSGTQSRGNHRHENLGETHQNSHSAFQRRTGRKNTRSGYGSNNEHQRVMEQSNISSDNWHGDLANYSLSQDNARTFESDQYGRGHNSRSHTPDWNQTHVGGLSRSRNASLAGSTISLNSDIHDNNSSGYRRDTNTSSEDGSQFGGDHRRRGGFGNQNRGTNRNMRRGKKYNNQQQRGGKSYNTGVLDDYNPYLEDVDCDQPSVQQESLASDFQTFESVVQAFESQQKQNFEPNSRSHSPDRTQDTDESRGRYDNQNVAARGNLHQIETQRRNPPRRPPRLKKSKNPYVFNDDAPMDQGAQPNYNLSQDNVTFESQQSELQTRSRTPELNQSPLGFPGSRNPSPTGSNISLNSDFQCSNTNKNNSNIKKTHGKPQHSNNTTKGSRLNSDKKMYNHDQKDQQRQRKNVEDDPSEKQTVVLTVEQVKELLRKDKEEIVNILTEEDNEYSDMLTETFQVEVFIVIIEVLSKVCNANPSNKQIEILRKASLPQFLDHIFNFVTEFPYIEDKIMLNENVNSFYQNVISLYSTFSDFRPSAMRMWLNNLLEVEKSMKVIIKNSIDIDLDPTLLTVVKSLLKDFSNELNEGKEAVTSKNPAGIKKNRQQFFPDPVGDFRTVPLHPRPEDVYGQQPFLYPNIVDGPYGNVDQYLDIHFKLLREDFMSPIRQALRDYKKQQNTKDKFKRIDNVRIYRKVKFLHPKTVFDKVGYEVCFDVDKKIKGVNWEFSNRFLFGSLLLFTDDHFDTFFLATVANRNVKELEKKLVIVELVENLENAKSILGKEFIMAESQAYFEPYFHVLKALQRFNNTNFPMARYIVGAHTETAPPEYLTEESVYNISTDHRYFTFRVLSEEEWPSNDDLGLDISQHAAYKAALTNDLVVIQGPPGTGKTFLGLKIARALLGNAHVWNRTSSPILVVCFTNHALDQFLEGLLPVTSKLVRIGGRSKGSELDKFNIRERRREYNYYKKSQTRELRDLNLKMSSVFAEIKTHQTNLHVLDTVGVLSVKTLALVMTPEQQQWFGSDDQLMDWLLSGVGGTVDKKVKITITADRGVVREESQVDPQVADAEDNRVKQAFFDTVELDTAAPPPEETVMVHLACDLQLIENKLKEILSKLKGGKIRQRNELLYLQNTTDNLQKIITHLRKELVEAKKYPRSAFEEERLLKEKQPFLQADDRWRLYHTWANLLRNGLIVELGNKETQFKEHAFQYEQLRQNDDIQILKTSHVVGTTTTIAARLQPMFTALAPKIVIVEEAAEVLEAHIIASLTISCEHLILIGDHKQLRPTVAETRLARQYHLDVSLFERMVKNGMACHTLTLQHRMRPEVSQQLVPTIYPTLRDHESVRTRDPIKGMEKNVFFMTHNNFEDEVLDITSKKNQFEADILLKLAKYLVQQGYKPSEITILATYKGQMYYMNNELKKIDGFPKGIQITVVDNFQGEENRIILLSLVRSNAAKRIGFLETENRVCVALSRARDGMYIIGNMDNLVSSSEIWPHIKNSLVRQQAFGPSLKLRCQVHPQQVTEIRSEKDFSRVGEGGCSLICGQQLKCGHGCKSMCHVSQDYHRIYKCKEPCPKILCQDGHQCPKKCFQKCEECKVPMRRQLACEHFADVPCHMDTRNYKCLEIVEVLVPLCRHTVSLPCHQKYRPTCNLPCVIRLECGHSCEKVCHVDDDPEHTDYACTKRCPRLNKDCSGDHACRKLCFEVCLPCPFKVEKQLPCGHNAKVLCSTDVTTVLCKGACERTRNCGHPCDKKCWEDCHPCFVSVEKTVPVCGHKVRVACSQEASRQLCDGPCSRMLQCGHNCAKRCRDPCSSDDCLHPKKFKITTLLCGHKNATVPCNKAKLVHQMPGEELMQYCVEPCGQLLNCEHPCSGSCSECMQGRIHKVCEEPCGNVLICGHSCKVPCREVCPPCDQPCTYSCKHSKCSRKCGQVCVPCKEPCDYACEHLKCTKLCGDPCDRPPCYKPCKLTLPCDHSCVGFCGEPCPPCRQCHPDDFPQFFYTDEESDPNSRWVYIEECKHVFESSCIEYWLNMKQEGREIVLKACPQCKTPITKLQRFMNLIKLTYSDIQQVKHQCFGKMDDIRKQRLQSLKKLQEIQFVDTSLPGQEPDELEDLYKKLKNELPEVTMKKRNVIHAQKVRLLCFLTEFFIALYERKQQAWTVLDVDSKVKVHKKINFLSRLLRKRELKISEQEMKSFELELKRILRLCDLLTYTSSYEYRMLANLPEIKNTRTKADMIINSVALYSNRLEDQMTSLLNTLKQQIKSTTVITDAEKAMINQAMASSFHSSQKTGHWFKCKNGHLYCITECGGAMQEAVCPVRGCGEAIGGRHHALRPDQTLASEMDGARHAAWSDQNNMANFGFQF